MTEPTTEELVERLNSHIRENQFAPKWIMGLAAQRLSDLEGKLGEATAVVLALFDQWPDNSAPSGPLCVRASNVINASEALKLTASGGGEGSSSASSTEHSGPSTPRTSAPSDLEIEQLARRFHETYERLAPQFSYKTRKASAVPWAEVPSHNKRLMIAVCAEILTAGGAGQ